MTRHSHRFGDPASVQLWRAGAQLYAEVLRAADLIHEEHATIRLQPGVYQVWMQREYSPQAIRRVRD